MPSSLARFLFETGHLKRVPRSGWALAGVDRPESVAEHSHRVDVIAWVLAQMEGGDVGRACEMAALHDLPEARVGDFHRLAKRYVDAKGAVHRAFADQTSALPEPIRERARELWDELGACRTLEAKVVHDADHIDCLLQAREYAESGHDVEEWMRSSVAALETESARDLADEVLRIAPGEWRRVD